MHLIRHNIVCLWLTVSSTLLTLRRHSRMPISGLYYVEQRSMICLAPHFYRFKRTYRRYSTTTTELSLSPRHALLLMSNQLGTSPLELWRRLQTEEGKDLCAVLSIPTINVKDPIVYSSLRNLMTMTEK